MTIFGTAFSPSHEFLIGVSSDGRMLVWNLGVMVDVDIDDSPDVDDDSGSQGSDSFSFHNHDSKRRKIDDAAASWSQKKPYFQFQVCAGALYDVQFIPASKNGDEKSLIMTCGDEGVFIYDDFLPRLKDEGSSSQDFPIPQCKSHLNPNLNAYGSMFPAEFNKISYDSSSGQLFGAAGDGNGYIWDIRTSKLLGKLGHDKYPTKRMYSEYLHTIQVIEADSSAPCHGCVLTGGEQGALSMWSGKDMKLIDTFDSLLLSSSSSSHTNKHPNRPKCWISSIAVDGTCNWSTIGGGRITKNASGGFLQLLNLHNRSIMSSTYKETVETLHDIAYHPSGVLSVGNDGAVSSWPSLALSQGRIGYSQGSSPSSYSIAVHPENGMVATGNVCASVDCFTDYLSKACTLIAE